MTEKRRLWRPWVRAGLGIAISVAFATATVSRLDWAVMADAWLSVGYAMLGLAVALSVAEVSARALRWRILLRPLAHVRFGSSLAYLSIGHLANAILPARLGDIARAILTGSRIQVSRASVLGTIAVERVADAGLLGLAATTGVLVGYGQLAPAVVALLIAGTAAVAVTIAATIVLGRAAVAATRVGALLVHHGRRFLAGAAALRQPVYVARIGLLTVTSFSLAIAIMVTVSSAVGISLLVWQAALVVAAVTLSTAIPAGPASIGTYEFAGVTVLAAMGHPPETALLTVALVHVIVTVPPAVMGLAAMWLLGIRPIALGLPGTHAAAVERVA